MFCVDGLEISTTFMRNSVEALCSYDTGILGLDDLKSKC